jgi:hypothetical protein
MTPCRLSRLPRTLLCFLALGIAACHSRPHVPVTGTLAGQHVATTVDAEPAKYYLAHYLHGQRTARGYDTAIDIALQGLHAEPSDREALRQLTQRFSTDFATIHFVARLYDMPANRRAQDTFHAFLSQLTTVPTTPAAPFPEASTSYLFAFVPGYAYKKDPTTGADFARQRHVMMQAGFHTLLIETDELGSVEQNAAIIADVLLRLREQPYKVILVSASKGGPEVALALGERLPAATLGHVRAWISVGGLLRGSPYADRWLQWPKCWLARLVFVVQGLQPSVIRNLSTAVRSAAFARLSFPTHILTLQYVGVPLSGHISPSTRGRYSALQPVGPNDGLTLLADELVPGGMAVTDVGLDHYYRDPIIDLKTLALAYVVLEELQRRSKTTE